MRALRHWLLDARQCSSIIGRADPALVTAALVTAHVPSNQEEQPDGNDLMSLLRPGRRRGSAPRVFVLGLDGVPWTYLKAEISKGRLPGLQSLFATGTLAQLHSSVPAVSSTAWTSFATGHDPGGHGIYGFMDCRPDSHEYYFPNATHVRVPALWDVIGAAGKRSVIVNVPGTYPARAIPGSLISGFVAPSLERSVYPPALLGRLQAMKYRIDIDGPAVRGSLELLEADLFATFATRKQAIQDLLAEDDWDLFVAVITETDRLYHFWWNAMVAGDPRVVDVFHRFHAEVDRFAAWLAEALPSNTHLLTLSDHGFTTENVDVFTNAWLQEQGYLQFDTPTPKGLGHIKATSTVYSLDPGRFYVNRAGCRPRGSVAAGDVAQVVERLIGDLAQLREPHSGELAYSALLRRDDAFHGEATDQGPDVVLTLRPGYELKGATSSATVFRPPGPGLGGMHTHDDAHLFVPVSSVRPGPLALHDVAPTIVELLELDHEGFFGTSVLGDSPKSTTSSTATNARAAG